MLKLTNINDFHFTSVLKACLPNNLYSDLVDSPSFIIKISWSDELKLFHCYRKDESVITSKFFHRFNNLIFFIVRACLLRHNNVPYVEPDVISVFYRQAVFEIFTNYIFEVYKLTRYGKSLRTCFDVKPFYQHSPEETLTAYGFKFTRNSDFIDNEFTIFINANNIKAYPLFEDLLNVSFEDIQDDNLFKIHYFELIDNLMLNITKRFDNMTDVFDVASLLNLSRDSFVDLSEYLPEEREATAELNDDELKVNHIIFRCVTKAISSVRYSYFTSFHDSTQVKNYALYHRH